MADSEKTLFYVFRNGQNFHIIEMTSGEATDWRGSDERIEVGITLEDAIGKIKSALAGVAIAFTAKCPSLGHRQAAHYWPLGLNDSLPRMCPERGCGPLVRENFAD